MADEETPAPDRERPHEHASADAADAGADSRQLLAWIGAIVAPLTLLTALAYYFGWRRERAFAGYFGIDPSVLGLSSNDYVLRSVGPLFAPFACLLLVGFAFVCARLLLAGHQPPRWLTPVTLAVGFAALLVGLLLAAGRGISSNFIYLQAFAPALGVVLIAYALGRSAAAADPRHRGALRGLHYLTVPVVLVSLFWATAEYADSRGLKEAETLRGEPHHRPLGHHLQQAEPEHPPGQLRLHILLSGWRVQEPAQRLPVRVQRLHAAAAKRRRLVSHPDSPRYPLDASGRAGADHSRQRRRPRRARPGKLLPGEAAGRDARQPPAALHLLNGRPQAATLIRPRPGRRMRA